MLPWSPACPSTVHGLEPFAYPPKTRRGRRRPMSPPLVSVLLPVRDAAATLDQALDSLLAQTMPALEIVAVDDGSRDDSGPRLEAWAARDPRVRVLRGPPRGLVAALEEGRRQARAPFLARMDADDLCHG